MSGLSLTVPVLFLPVCPFGRPEKCKLESDIRTDCVDLPEALEYLVRDDPWDDDHRDGDTGICRREAPAPKDGPNGSLSGRM